MRFKAKAFRTNYWKPGTDFLLIIKKIAERYAEPGDIIVLSEKALSVALGRIVDESAVKPSGLSRFIAKFWMRMIWGYFLGPICRLSHKTLARLRQYPLAEGAAHKQLALSRAGFLQSLRHGSEGAIDVSNVAHSYAVLPLQDAPKVAEAIESKLNERGVGAITVMIVDSDKTYTLGTMHITPRPRAIRGIRCLGLLAYVIGRCLRLKARSTPIASCGTKLDVEESLRIAAFANRARGSGSGRTAWDMAERFGVGLTEVTWGMLQEADHYPIVIVRRVTRELRPKPAEHGRR